MVDKKTFLKILGLGEKNSLNSETVNSENIKYELLRKYANDKTVSKDKVFASDRSPVSHFVCVSVRPFGTKLSRVHNLHLLASDSS